MSTKTATLTLANDGMRFEAVVGSGHTIVMDDGESDTGARPSELLGVALAGCTAMDVISILRKKRQPVMRYEVQVSGEQVDGGPPRARHGVGRQCLPVQRVRRGLIGVSGGGLRHTNSWVRLLEIRNQRLNTTDRRGGTGPDTAPRRNRRRNLCTGG